MGSPNEIVHVRGSLRSCDDKRVMASLKGSIPVHKLHLVSVAVIVATFLIFDAAFPTPASARWWDYPHSGYCPPGTCNKIGGWRALDVRNCRPANCQR
jgi:hypothetical protein